MKNETYPINVGTHIETMDRQKIVNRLGAYNVLSPAECRQYKTDRLAALLEFQEKETRRMMPETIKKFLKSQQENRGC